MTTVLLTAVKLEVRIISDDLGAAITSSALDPMSYSNSYHANGKARNGS